MDRTLRFTRSWAHIPPEILPTLGMLAGLAFGTGVKGCVEVHDRSRAEPEIRTIPAPAGQREPRPQMDRIILTG